MDIGLGGCWEEVTFNYINVSISLSVCSLSISLSPCPSLFYSLGGRKIKVFCFLCKIFVSAFWVYLKIILSRIRCLSFSVCKQSDVRQTLLSAGTIIKSEIKLRDVISELFVCIKFRETGLTFVVLSILLVLIVKISTQNVRILQ